MKIILSTASRKELERGLEKQADFKAVYRYIMSLDYFCFFGTEKKKDLNRLKRELYIYFSNFSQPLHILALHNSAFYEYPGINKLNYWDYFRNVVSLDSTEEVAYTNPELLEKCEAIFRRVDENNFNLKNDYYLTI